MFAISVFLFATTWKDEEKDLFLCSGKVPRCSKMRD